MSTFSSLGIFATASKTGVKMSSNRQKQQQQKEEQLFEKCVPAAWPSPLPFHLKAVAWISVSLFCALFYLSPLAVVLCPFLLYYRPVAGGLLLAAMVTSLLWPKNEWPAARKFCQLWWEVFDFHHNILDPKKREEFANKYKGSQRAILCSHPHGIIPIQALLWAAYCDQFVPEAYGFGAAASVVCYIPFLCNVVAWLTAGPADYATLYNGMTKKHKNLFILPGGVAEIYYAKPGSDAVYFRRRKGLIRLALQTGADLIPVYFFGANYMFEQLATSDGWLGKFSRSMKMGITFFWGQYGLPIPFRTKVCICLGDPIQVKKVESPTAEQIEELQAVYIQKMEELFEKHKAAAGYPDAVLKIT